jgi:hypothetical protein
MPEAASAPVPAPAAAEPKLDDIMLAMDVVDTLRHQEQVVARELDEDARAAELMERLRRIYESQGLTVNDRILAEGVRALRESRFVYTPPPPGLARTLARLWVSRGRWGRGLGIAVLVVAVAWAGWRIVFVGAAEREATRARIEMTETLPAELDRLHKAVLAEARVPEARDRAAAALADGRLALARQDKAGVTKAIDTLTQLLDRLRADYVLRIVSRPNEQSGIWRVPQGRPGTRNFYLVVEAVAADGSLVKLPVTSEEDQKTSLVDRFGVRVSEAVFDQIRRDKGDDGIIQRAILGQKPRGALDPTYALPVLGGFVTAGW